MTKRIVIVEDEGIVAKDISRKVEQLGYSVQKIISSGERVKEEIMKSPPDLIFMDIVLKGELDGIETAQQIREHYNIPIIYITAYADEKTLERVKMTEPYGYIVKPFDSRDLRIAMEIALHKHEADQDLKKSREKFQSLYEELTTAKQGLNEQLMDHTTQIEMLLDTRKKLQTEKRWNEGLKIILDGVIKLGFTRCGLFLVNSAKNTLDFHLGRGFSPPLEKTSIALDESSLIGVRCVRKKETYYQKGIDSSEEATIFNAQSFVWIPIIVQDEAFAVIAADKGNENSIIPQEDIHNLEILSSICSVFIDRTRILVESMPEKMLHTPHKYRLESATAYIVLEKKPEKSYEIFCELVTHGIPGLIISRQHPKRLKTVYGLHKTPIFWLSKVEAQNVISPDDLPKLMYIINDFIQKGDKSIILLDGLEYLIIQTEFLSTIKFLHQLRDLIILNNSQLIIPLFKDALPEREFNILEREFQIFSS
jgi:AmiR/NasT family two-component response regulator